MLNNGVPWHATSVWLVRADDEILTITRVAVQSAKKSGIMKLKRVSTIKAGRLYLAWYRV